MEHKSEQAVETIAFQILCSSVDIAPQHENITESESDHTQDFKGKYTVLHCTDATSLPLVYTHLLQFETGPFGSEGRQGWHFHSLLYFSEAGARDFRRISRGPFLLKACHSLLMFTSGQCKRYSSLDFLFIIVSCNNTYNTQTKMFFSFFFYKTFYSNQHICICNSRELKNDLDAVNSLLPPKPHP